jgi:hypothetical protein
MQVVSAPELRIEVSQTYRDEKSGRTVPFIALSVHILILNDVPYLAVVTRRLPRIDVAGLNSKSDPRYPEFQRPSAESPSGCRARNAAAPAGRTNRVLLAQSRMLATLLAICGRRFLPLSLPAVLGAVPFFIPLGERTGVLAQNKRCANNGADIRERPSSSRAHASVRKTRSTGSCRLELRNSRPNASSIPIKTPV